ncbi:hypothetical protein DH2020_026623 [Rehmannia glutinosa]|uniref:Uncharacterized protein n=1 Tax=Rehmannia glutinosa TaxID=99300 RepID=A0ABR0W0U1_REHGL
MATMAQLRYSPLAGHYCRPTGAREVTNFSPIFADSTFPKTVSLPSLKCSANIMLNPGVQTKFHLPCAVGGGGDIGVGNGNGGGNGGSGGWSGGGGDSDESKSSSDGFGPIGAFVNGWRSRVSADPQFPFKVLMEEVVGVSSCVLGDMASRPNFGLNELDFVFSTLVVGSIMNFVLMYLLAPTMSSSTQTLPAIFASSPTSTLFACVGFAAGLVGTAISNGLITMRKKMDPSFETPNKPPPAVLNAVTWAIHMGTSVVVLRCLNNILGGMSFVVLARLTGSQSVDGGVVSSIEEGLIEKKHKLVNEADELQANEPTSK